MELRSAIPLEYQHQKQNNKDKKMSKRIKPSKPLPRHNFDDGVGGVAGPKLATLEVSGGSEPKGPRGVHPFDAVPARRKREAALEPDGVVKKSGSDKPLEKIKRNGISKYKKAAGAKYGTLADYNPSLFDREAKKQKSGE
jgi:hypothetical protein